MDFRSVLVHYINVHLSPKLIFADVVFDRPCRIGREFGKVGGSGELELGSRRGDCRLEFPDSWGRCDEGIVATWMQSKFQYFLPFESDGEKSTRQFTANSLKGPFVFKIQCLGKSIVCILIFEVFNSTLFYRKSLDGHLVRFITTSFCWRLVTKGIFFSCFIFVTETIRMSNRCLLDFECRRVRRMSTSRLASSGYLLVPKTVLQWV